ncbi:MAG TPA: nuclear transport factor 2 family protein [Candidatus Binatia bacterium]
MPSWPIAEVEEAFRNYWRTGAVGENWDAWADLFTEDALYVEHVLGNRNGREEIRQWIKPIMAQYGELYTVYEWHLADPSGRVVVYMQNRRDHPSGHGVLDFPGITILQYAGGGKWCLEEDYWAMPAAMRATEDYAAARAKHDPAHNEKRTRGDWGNGPDWTRGAATYWAAHPKIDA